MEISMAAALVIDVTGGEIRLMMSLTSLCQKGRQKESTKHKALVPV